jgi:hypothetical protein
MLLPDVFPCLLGLVNPLQLGLLHPLLAMNTCLAIDCFFSNSSQASSASNSFMAASYSMELQVLLSQSSESTTSLSASRMDSY